MPDTLRRRLRGIAARLDGVMGLYVHALATGETVAVAADEFFQMASVFKIPILAELLTQVEAGRRSLDERITLADEMKSPGSGVLKELSAGTALTVKDLATLMIIISDNTATDILLGLVTRDAVNARLRACGLERTTVTMSCRDLLRDLVGMSDAPDTPDTRRTVVERLRTRRIDPNCRAYREPAANMTTPREMGRLLEAVVRPTLDHGRGEAPRQDAAARPRDGSVETATLGRGEAPRQDAAAYPRDGRIGVAGNGAAGPLPLPVCRGMLDIMRRQQVRDRLPLLLPPGVEMAHKTGSVTGVSNDAAILYAPRSVCVVAVFTRDLASDLKGRAAIGQVGRAVYDAYA